MAKKDYLSHDNMDGQGPVERAEKETDYVGIFGAENLAQAESGDGAIAFWMNSPPHKV